MANWRQFFNKVVSIGIDETLEDKQKKRVRILNVATLIVLFNASFFLLFDFINGPIRITQILALSFELVGFSVILFLHHLKIYKAAKYVFTSSIFILIFYHCNYAFKGYYGEYQYIVIPLFSLFFFDSKFIHYALLSLAIIAFYVPNLYLDIYPQKYFGYLNVLLLFVGIFLIVNFFKTLNDKNERLLLKEKNQVLSDKILLEKQQAELKELSEFKAQFFINLSHEIRTPITLIKGYAEHLKTPKNDTSSKEYLYRVKNQVLKIEELVDDMLNLSKLDANKLELRVEPTELISLLHSIYVNFKSLFEKKEVEFVTNISIPQVIVNLDSNLFTKAINNLLSNALKFTRPKDRVKIKVSYEDKLLISIEDTGIGIPKKDLDKVFDRFYQSKNDITDSQGSGIGLSFAKSIIEAHGFKLLLTSKVNYETKVCIHIDADQLNEERTPIISNPHDVMRDKCIEVEEIKDTTVQPLILVVEDDPEMRALYRLMLQRYAVVEAINGIEGLKALDGTSFDLIVTDYMMPAMDGKVFVSEVKRKHHQIPIIVVSARTDQEGKMSLLRLGIDAYLTKPFSEEELLLAINRSINLYNQLREYSLSVPQQEVISITQDNVEFNERIQSLINNYLNDKNFGVEQLADYIGMSRSSLFRKTKLLLGQTPNELINEARLQKAKTILSANPNISRKVLADQVGFSNAGYFYKKLEERFNIQRS